MLIKCVLILTLFNYGLTQNCFDHNGKRNLNLKLVCYYSEIDENVDACKCTHVILPSDTNRTNIEKFKKKLQGSKVLITVNEINQNLIDILKSETVDGIEINLKKLSHKNDINDFITTIKSKINSNLIISILLPSKTETLVKYYDLKALTKGTDFFLLQTAFLASDQNVTFHPSRLSGLWDMQNTDSIVDLVHGLGVPLSKLVITAPVQAFEFLLQNETLTAPLSHATEVKSISRNELCEKISSGLNWTLERDQDLASPYIFSKKEWIAFEDATSIDVKTKYARVRGLGGLALKDLSQDSKNCNGSILEFAYDGLSKQSRAPRGVVTKSLKREILKTPSRPLDTIQISPYRISRIIDVEGNVHSIRKDTRTEFECARQGYFVHPRSCGRFYRCIKFDQLADEFNVFEFDCPDGLTFDEKSEVCVWPGSLPYSSACTGSSEIAPVPRTRFICPGEEGYYADPENCRWFFACLDHGKSPLSAYEFRCPFGLAFEQSRLVCEWSWLVPGCGSIETLDITELYGRAKLESYDGLGALGVVKFDQLDGSIHRLGYNSLGKNSATATNFITKIEQGSRNYINGVVSQENVQPNILSAGYVYANAPNGLGSKLSPITNSAKLTNDRFLYKTFAVPSGTTNIVGGASAVQFYNQNSNVLQSRPVAFSTPSSVATVVAAPVPILTSNGETYKDGVVANVPQLQFKIIVPDELRFNNEFEYAQRANVAGSRIYNFGALDLNRGAQKNLSFGYSYEKPNVVLESSTNNPYFNGQNRFGAAHQLDQSGNIEQNAIYAEENGVSSTIRPKVASSFSNIKFESLAVSKVEQVGHPIQVSTYGFSDQNADFGKARVVQQLNQIDNAQSVVTASAPVVSVDQNSAALSSSITLNQQGYVYSEPSVRYEEYPSSTPQPAVVSNLKQFPIISEPVQTVVSETGNYKENVELEGVQINNKNAQVHKVTENLNNYRGNTVIPASPISTTYFNVQPQLKTFTAAIQTQKSSTKFEESSIVQPTAQFGLRISEPEKTSQNVLLPVSGSSYSGVKQQGYIYSQPSVIFNESPRYKLQEATGPNVEQVPVVSPTVQTFATNYKQQDVGLPITAVRNSELEQPNFPASLSSYSVQELTNPKPNVAFTEFRSSTVRPAIAAPLQLPVILPTVQTNYHGKSDFQQEAAVPIAPVKNLELQQPNFPASVSSYSVQGSSNYKPNVAFTEFRSSTARPAIVANSQQLPVVQTNYHGQSDFQQETALPISPVRNLELEQPSFPASVSSYSVQGSSNYKPNVAFTEFRSSTARPAIVANSQQLPVVQTNYHSQSVFQQDTALPISPVRKLEFDQPKFPASVTSYSVQGRTNLKPNVAFTEFRSSTVRPAIAVHLQLPVVLPTVQTNYHGQSDFQQETALPIVPVRNLELEQPNFPASVSSYSVQGLTNPKPNVAFTKFRSSTVRPAIIANSQQLPVVQTNYNGQSAFQQKTALPIAPLRNLELEQPNFSAQAPRYSAQTQQGYIYQKPNVLFNEFPSSTVRPAIVSNVKQQVQTIQAIEEQPAPVATYNIDLRSKPAFQQVQQVNPSYRPQVTTFRPNVFSYNIKSQLRPLEETVVVSNLGQNIESVTNSPSAVTYDFRKFTKTAAQAQDTANILAINNLSEQQPIAASPTVSSFTARSQHVQPLQVQKVESAIGVENTVSQPSVVSEYNFKNYQNFKPNGQSEPIEIALQQQPAVISSYSFENAKYKNVEPKLAQVTRGENFIQPSVWTNFGQKTDSYVNSVTQHESRYNFQDGVKIRPQTVNFGFDTQFVQGQPPSSAFRGYQYPKTNVVVEEKRLEQAVPIVRTKTVTAVTPITIEDTIFTKQEVKVAPTKLSTSESLQKSGYFYSKPRIPLDEGLGEQIVEEPFVAKKAYLTYQQVDGSSEKTSQIGEKKGSIIEDYSYTGPQTVQINAAVNQGASQPAIVYNEPFGAKKANFEIQLNFDGQSGKEVQYSNTRPIQNLKDSGYYYPKPSVTFSDSLDDYENKQPVVEEPFVAKKAYLTYQKVDAATAKYGNEIVTPVAVKTDSIIEDYSYTSPQTVQIDAAVNQDGSQPAIVYNEPFGAKKPNFEVKLNLDGQSGKEVQYSNTRPIQNLKDSGYYYPKPSVTFSEGLDDYENKQPVVEEPFVAKKAYLTYGDASSTVKVVNEMVTPVAVKKGSIIEDYSYSAPRTAQLDSSANQVATQPPIVCNCKKGTSIDFEKVIFGGRKSYFEAQKSEELNLNVGDDYPKPSVKFAEEPLVGTYQLESDGLKVQKYKDGPQRKGKSGPAYSTRQPNLITPTEKTFINPIYVEDFTAAPESYTSTLTDNSNEDEFTVRKLAKESKPKSLDEGVIVESYSFEPQRTEDVTLQPDGATRTSAQPSSKLLGKKLVRIRPVTTTEFIQIEETRQKEASAQRTRGRGKATTEAVINRHKHTGAERDTTSVRGTSAKSRSEEETTRAIQSSSFDRYGPGGLRSNKETLQGTVNCQREGLFRHPEKCNKFYACRWDCKKDKYTLHVFNCPVHLTFDYNMGACNWPSKGPACVGDTLLLND